MGEFSDFSWDAGRLWETEGREHAEDGIDDASEFLLAESRAVVPYDDGPLSESGKASRDDLTGLVSYDQPYAVRQHEEMDWNHAPGRKAKYLEDPLNESQEELLGLIAERITRWLA
jgi:hypothetical protein